MMGELAIGRRYRITLKSKAFPGSLEGRVRSVKLPRGVLGNHDGSHSIWLSGETFEWFLRPDEIRSAHEVPENSSESSEEPPMTALLGRRSCGQRIAARGLPRPLGARTARPARAEDALPMPNPGPYPTSA